MELEFIDDGLANEERETVWNVAKDKPVFRHDDQCNCHQVKIWRDRRDR